MVRKIKKGISKSQIEFRATNKSQISRAFCGDCMFELGYVTLFSIKTLVIKYK
jgi:hypothetical protein